MLIRNDLTLAPVAWIYADRVWLLRKRATGMPLGAVASWLFNFALSLSYSEVTSLLGDVWEDD
ncbi:hypothetical protein F4825DRAFT_427455 [Nemania diffusa]|nr:hypothetical protein F4825DRAFT_427455 [Nemania diffusa]